MAVVRSVRAELAGGSGGFKKEKHCMGTPQRSIYVHYGPLPLKGAGNFLGRIFCNFGSRKSEFRNFANHFKQEVRVFGMQYGCM